MIKEKGEKGKNHVKNRIFLIIKFIFFLFLEKLRFFITFFPFSPQIYIYEYRYILYARWAISLKTIIIIYF